MTLMTMMSQTAELQPPLPRPRNFPSGLVLVAAVELILIAAVLRAANTQGFYPAVCACGLCSFQLCILLINRFGENTRNIRRLARSAEFSNQPVFITDPNGRIKWTNPQFTRLTGYGLAEVVGKTFSMVLHGQDTDTHIVETIREQIRKQQPFEGELQQYDRMGLSHWVSTKGEPILDAHGELTHYVVTQTDITEERRQSQSIIEALTSKATPMTGISPERVGDLTRKLESLGTTDHRDLLQDAVNGLRGGMREALAALPAGRQGSKNQTPMDGKLEERNSNTRGEQPSNE